MVTGFQIRAAAGAVLLFPLLAIAAPEVQFNRDIRPILSDRCYTCHGPDPANRKSKLRFDNEAGAKQDLGGRFAIVAGDPAKSVLIDRVTTEKKGLRMPPLASGPALSERETALLRAWIEQGAKWQNHWSLLPVTRPELPAVQNTAWVRNPIDRFILARLEREGLAPQQETDRPTLIRRVSLDITGIAPTPAEVDAFVNDGSPNAYEKVVDRLLGSPRYGERMAARWLDAARYADTNGYQTDAERFMWRWRDWVIEAFNRNQPFDRFTVDQLAGDLVPNATLDQRIATGFNRNHRGNGEGGIVPAEFLVEYAVDRVETTSTVWLGMTMGCTRCHDHKYDPLSQKEFYQMFAFFNNIPERGKAWKYGNSPPVVKAPTPPQQAELNKLDARVSSAERAFAGLKESIARQQAAWEKSAVAAKAGDWSIVRGIGVQYALDGAAGGVKPLGGEVTYEDGRVGKAARFDGKRYLDCGDTGVFSFYDHFTFSAWIYPEAETGAIFSRAQDVSEGVGYGLYLNQGKLQLNLVQRWLDDALRIETAEGLELNRWQHVAVTYDGSRVATGVKFYVNGQLRKPKVILDELNQSFDIKEPFRIGAGNGSEFRFKGLIDEVRLYRLDLEPDEIAVQANATPIGRIIARARSARSVSDSDKLRYYYLDVEAPANIREAWRELLASRREREKYYESIPTVMVMQENPLPKDTFLLIRGAYDRPGEKVSAGVPKVLPPLPDNLPRNRLGLAKWLVDPKNPLPARVTVNRFWQAYFGVGMVKTVEDFGSQGEWPVHLELLDWLASEFVSSGWDMKALQKTIVMSAAYRQSSRVAPDLLQRDPENRLLARGPRYRLPAEVVRDQALAASGLLVEKLGGPSVKPYQPAGLWKELSGTEDYQQDHGENLYRRSLYTFWKRTSAPPSMMTFDAAGRETCVVRENRTNTPLQALTLMNDVAFLEAARRLGQRMMLEAGPSPEARINWGFRLATARIPSPRKLQVLRDSYFHYLDEFKSSGDAAEKLIRQGESPRDQSLDAAELAAYSTVASLILNLDETVSKE